jgi:sirohydrochlorin cobaltochelatase
MESGKRTGLLLVGHGTRSESGRRQFHNLVAALAGLACNSIVEPAFLELAQPDIATAVARLANRGAAEMVVLPFMLFAAEHVKHDIPAAVRDAVARLPHDLPWVQAAHLGCDPLIVSVSELRFREAVAHRPTVPESQTCSLLVGRGNHDESAIAEMRRFADLRHGARFAEHTAVAFLAMAQPNFSDELQRLADQGFRRIVVQPHLLFEGELIASIRSRAATLALGYSNLDVVVTAELADPPDEPKHATNWLAAAANRSRMAIAVQAFNA